MTAERAAFLRERFGIPAATMEPVGAGWDSDTYEVDGRWIFRFPRRPPVEERVRHEIRFLPELAGALSAPVPRFEFVSLEPLVVGYAKLDGVPLKTPPLTVARELGRFLGELHSFPVERARDLGVPQGELEPDLDDFRERVLPLLDPGERRTAATLLAEPETFSFAPVFIHGDLGPEHLLVDGSRLSGVIDWSDARIGDPAIDFAWLLHGTTDAFAGELVRAYYGTVDADLRRRTLFFHRLGPWHEVVYGLETGIREYVDSGLAGIRLRLPKASVG